MKRAWENWRLYGLPRCMGWGHAIGTDCHRLLWPWFDIGGDGESPMCRGCTTALRRAWRAPGDD